MRTPTAAKGGEARHVSLLRGINVGGHHKVPTAWLREAYESLGCEDVATYLQSGNVVFRRDRAPADVSRELEAVITKELGFAVAVLGRTHADLARIVADDRFPAADPSRRLVVFLSDALADATAARLAQLTSEREDLVVGRRELQLHCPDGIGRSKLAEAVSKNLPGSIVTARNWRTVTALADMSAPVPS